VLGPGDKLRVLESEYVTLTARYGEAHPDVIRTKRAIDALRTEVGGGSAHEEMQRQLDGKRAELAVAQDRYGEDYPAVAQLRSEVQAIEKRLDDARSARTSVPRATQPDNPAYIQIQANLQAIQTELASYGAKRGELAATIADFERKLAAAPQVEREYRALTRDYDSAALKFQEINAKLMEAQVSRTLETERMGERFTLIEPPLLPEKAEKPNRMAILLLGIVLAIGLSLGAGAVMESVDQTIRGRRMLTDLVGAAPLAVIPFITTDADLKAKSRPKVYLLAGIIIAATVIAIAFHFIIMPLDVLWFVVLRRLGV
jgi:uncharacterized protein involved in exopolysaccharide biosynthesis